jgi:hypothetical protein
MQQRSNGGDDSRERDTANRENLVHLIAGLAGYLNNPCVERLAEVESRMAAHLVATQSGCAVDVVEAVKRSPERFKRYSVRLAMVKIGDFDAAADVDDPVDDD